jgi:hypothetical protein
MITVTAGIRTVSEANSRGHWAAKYRRASSQRAIADAMVRAKAWDAMGHGAPEMLALAGGQLVVLLTRVGPTQGLDSDNLLGALKAVRDGVADALGIDDRDGRVEWRYAQRRGKAWAVEITVGTPTEMAQLRTAS